jgi:aldose 1-epimerase
MNLSINPFGKIEDKIITRYDFITEKGFSFSVINYGATLIDVQMPDKTGRVQSIIPGFDSLEEYRNHAYCFGATIGRFANRIGGASFSVEGTEYPLEANNGPNNLHGGPVGFNKVIWDEEVLLDEEEGEIRFTYTSPDGESGFPGTMETTVIYTFTEKGDIRIDYRAESDKTTPINLTNHTYWNLAGFDKCETVENHQLKIKAASYTPVDKVQIPTGIEPVKGTPMDFQTLRPIRQEAVPDKLYDHNWVLDGSGLREAAQLIHKGSGRELTVLTDQPGIQLYTAGGMGNIPERNGETYEFMGAALETQNFPNCVNEPDFPDCLLRPGKVFESTTIYRLILEEKK